MIQTLFLEMTGPRFNSALDLGLASWSHNDCSDSFKCRFPIIVGTGLASRTFLFFYCLN